MIQPTPRAPEPAPGRCVCGNSFDGDNLCMVSACQWEDIAKPSAPDDLREQIGHALESARCTHHESDACYDCEAVAVMVVLRRNGVIR